MPGRLDKACSPAAVTLVWRDRVTTWVEGSESRFHDSFESPEELALVLVAETKIIA